jgi:peptide/nickel transport system substrate-binding protein
MADSEPSKTRRRLQRDHTGSPAASAWGALSRRRLLTGGAAIAAGTGVLGVACGGKGNKSSSAGQATGAGTPKRGGSVTLSFNFERGFDPHILQPTDTHIMGMFYSMLLMEDFKTLKVVPNLAAKWEEPSATELVFTLAPNIKWHDKPPANARPLKADDIIYSYQRIQSADPRFVSKAYLTSVERMEAPDDHTLKLTLKGPDVTQLGNLALPGMKILAPEVVEKAGKFASADTAVGTGPFILQSSELNVGSQLTRNPAYFKAGLPYLDRINLKAFQDSQAEWAAFVAGQLAHKAVPGQEGTKFEQEQKDKYRLEWFGATGSISIAMPNTKRKPFDDPRVNRAMRLLMDHDELKSAWVDVWNGRGRFTSVLDAADADVWDFSEDEYRSKFLDWKKPKDDAIKEALTLLSAAGFTKDNPLKFLLAGNGGPDNQQALTPLMQAQYKRNSQGVVNPDIKSYELAAWNGVRANTQFDYFVAGQSSGGTDPDVFFSTSYQTGGGRNYGKMSDPKLDAMFAKQRTILDTTERKKAVRDIIVYMVDNCPYGATPANYVLNATQLNVHDFPAQGDTYNELAEWYERVWVES